jgi:hypothetical protein
MPDPDPERRVKLCAWKESKFSDPPSDAILPHEIPKSLSFCDWMRNQREAFEFLHPNSLKPKRKRKRK